MTTELDKSTAIVIIVAIAFHLVNTLVMGIDFGWPGNLGESAEANLEPIVIGHATTSMLGYTLYAVYSVLVWPVASMTVDVLRAGRDSPLLEVARGFGLASMLGRMIGLIRWLIAMPGLAAVYVHPDTTQSTKDVVVVLFDLLNTYFGGIGEGLGVGAFCATWLLLVSIFIIRDAGRFPKWLGYTGVLSSIVIYLNMMEIWHVDLGAGIIIVVVTNMMWYIAFVVVLLMPAKFQSTVELSREKIRASAAEMQETNSELA